ncbi:hypothetical protein [Methylomonas koyamae]|uniref:hypothetical protein n=1 Tax=Methylomonas koyamae TaxID=702114 RepID=UPI000A55B0F0|nr:hypothetical protein [Methylomonas koyamae]
MALAFVLLCLGSATLLLVPLAFRDLIDFGFGGKQTPANGGLADGLSLNGRFLALFALASLWAVTIAARYYTVSWVASGSRPICAARSTARCWRSRRNFSKPCKPAKCCRG